MLRKFNVIEVAVCRVEIISNEVLRQIYFFANPEIGYTTDAFIAFETGRKMNSVYCILLLVPLQTYIW